MRISSFYINYEKYSNIYKESKGVKLLFKKANIIVEQIKELYIIL